MLIGVVGFAGSGKGTFSDVLVSDYGFKKLAFADAVKDGVSVVFDWPRKLLEGDTEESRAFREKVDPWWTEKFGWDVTPRHIMQLFGTEAMREAIDQNIWIHALAAKIRNYKDVVVPDVRFPNEVQFIRDQGGFTIRVKRGREPEWYDAALSDNTNGTNLMEAYNVHKSEWVWIGSKFNALISNDSTLDALKAMVNYQLKVFTNRFVPTTQEILIEGDEDETF